MSGCLTSTHWPARTHSIPILIDAVGRARTTTPRLVFKLVANLPYNVATPIIANLLVDPVLCPDLDGGDDPARACGPDDCPSSSSAYGALSVLVQALAECSIVRVLPPSVFWPRPKVESAVISSGPIPSDGSPRRVLVPYGRPQGLLAPAEEPEACPCGDLARSMDQDRGRYLAGFAWTRRPGPRRGSAMWTSFGPWHRRSRNDGVMDAETDRPWRMNPDRALASWLLDRPWGARSRAAGGPSCRPDVPSWSTNSARSAMAFQMPASSSRAVSG